MKKIDLSSLVPLLLVLVSTLSTHAQFHRSGQTTRLSISGLRGDVTVRRDSRWIPFIEAKNDSDVFFAQGYITASDRLWQMDLMRRLARGETAEIFGNAAIDEDKRWRRFNFAKVGEDTIPLLSPSFRAAIEDYARGVNSYINSLNDDTLPLEFKILRYKPQPWRSTDTLLIGKILADGLSTSWGNDLFRASIRDLPVDKQSDLTDVVTPYDLILFGKDKADPIAMRPATAVPNELLSTAYNDEIVRRNGLKMVGLYAEDLAASNNWVISGKRTADGKPILANDPHLQPAAPGIWYLTELISPTLHVAGVTIPGVPGILLGHNEYIAWGATNVGPDVQDLYSEMFDSRGRTKTPTGWEPAGVRTEMINVRTNPLAPETQAVAFKVEETRHGPIVIEEKGKKYALQWTALDPKNIEFEAFFRWNRARNWADFKEGLRVYGGPAQNFVYADTKGNIGWYAASKIPVRRRGDGSVPYDGATDEGDWLGSIPFKQLPHLYNPPGGLIVTANQRIVGTNYRYPQMFRNAGSPWRARRIYNLLVSRKQITMDQVRDVQYDDFSIALSTFARAVLENGSASSETLQVLKQWDGKMTTASHGAILANEIRNCVVAKMQEDSKIPGDILMQRVLYKAIDQKLARWLPAPFKTYDELYRACDVSVHASLADPNRFGPDPATWTWGRNFTSRFPHPLASAPVIGKQFATPNVPLNGSGQTPNVGSGVSMRLITSPGNWDSTRQVIPLGQSGDPGSPFYKDQFEAWRTGLPMAFPFTRKLIETTAKDLWILTPNYFTNTDGKRTRSQLQ